MKKFTTVRGGLKESPSNLSSVRDAARRVLIRATLERIAEKLSELFPQSTFIATTNISIRNINRAIVSFATTLSRHRYQEYTVSVGGDEICISINKEIKPENHLNTWNKLQEVVEQQYIITNNPEVLQDAEFINQIVA